MLTWARDVIQQTSLIAIRKCPKHSHTCSTLRMLQMFSLKENPAAMGADDHLALDYLLAARESPVPLKELFAACG